MISLCTEIARVERTARAVATIVRTKAGSWRVQVRRKGKYASQTFRLKSLANEWAVDRSRSKVDAVAALEFEDLAGVVRRGDLEAKALDDLAHLDHLLSIRLGKLTRGKPQ